MTVDKSKVSAREESTTFESFNLASYILLKIQQITNGCIHPLLPTSSRKCNMGNYPGEGKSGNVFGNNNTISSVCKKINSVQFESQNVNYIHFLLSV